MTATRMQVQAFLGKLGRAEAKAITILMRKKTVDFLAEMEMQREDVIPRLFGLTVSDYSYGPSPSDWPQGGDVWTFGDICNERQVYVKLCISKLPPGHSMVCMSYHAPEQSMRFPYANKK